MIRFVPIIVITCLLLAIGHADGANFDLKRLRTPTQAFLKSDEGRSLANHILTWQNPDGGWWKTYDYDRPRHLPEDRRDGVSGFDNGATYTETLYLAAAHRATADPRYADAVLRAIDFILAVQYPSGGWPQQVPTGDGYARHITYNDDAMIGVMKLLREVAAGEGDFAFVPPERRRAAAGAFERGVRCILDTQIRVDGQLTAWCAQHDRDTLAPAQARAYELPSISGGESATIVRLLMEIEHPSPEIQRAVHAAAAWFERSKIIGKRLERIKDATGKTIDTQLTDDPAAPPLVAHLHGIWQRHHGRYVRAYVRHGALDARTRLAQPH